MVPGIQVVWLEVRMPVTFIQWKCGLCETWEALIGNIQGVTEPKLFHVVDADDCMTFDFAALNAGRRRLARMAMTAITMRSSIRVNAEAVCDRLEAFPAIGCISILNDLTIQGV